MLRALTGSLMECSVCGARDRVQPTMVVCHELDLCHACRGLALREGLVPREEVEG
jgi:hypothetical protein